MAATRKAPARTKAIRALKQYNAKRNFDRTPEPRGESASGSALSFVVQQHDARRMHYDFRLELDGVLLSWAVPKGPSLDPADKRLAVQTEDHPVSYRNFEGNIPQGEYGGGAVIVWDRGTWTPEGDPHAALRKGHLSFSLDGEKLQGRFQLVRIRDRKSGDTKKNWLLMKRSDTHVRKGRAARVTELHPRSVLTGRRVEQVDLKTADVLPAKGRRAAAKKSTRKTATARKRSRMPSIDTLSPQLATLVDRPPPGDDWIYEVKFDGYRMLAAIDKGKVRLRSRNNLDWTRTLPAIAEGLGKLKLRNAILDGELCHVDAQGRSSFQRLQNALPRGFGENAQSANLTFYVFDVLYHDGVDVRPEPLLDRKQRLRILLGSKPPSPIVYSDHLEGDGHASLSQACAVGLEGLIAKRKDAPYRSARTRDWLKLKCSKRQEFVIVGMIKASGARKGFRSLLLGLRENGKLRYAGRVGTGFSDASLKDIAAQLDKRRTDKSPLDDPPRVRNAVWVKPELVCEVQFTEMTADGVLRHPSFQGLRQDKPARQVTRERAAPVAGANKTDDNRVGGVRITHPERVMDASSGATKLDFARYHETVSDWFLPYARQRPLALVRCPQGDAQQCFFQKHLMRGIGKRVKKRRIAGHEVLYVEEAGAVIDLVQFNAVEFHAWGATVADPDHPDWMVIDLDPDAALQFSDVVEAAHEVRDALKSVQLESWVRTTGGKGLHVCVPLQPEARWEEVKHFAQAIAQALQAQRPDRYVATMSKAKRKGKIFVDYLRNGQGATAVLPYSPRSRPGATVAMPVRWQDLGKLDPRDFTVHSTPRWIAKRKADPWKDFLGTRQRLPALDGE